jgi:hypothetical protein
VNSAAPRRRLDDIAMGLERPAAAAASGDADLPTREPLGERRAKFGRKAHALATMAAMDAGDDDDTDHAGCVRLFSCSSGSLPGGWVLAQWIRMRR